MKENIKTVGITIVLSSILILILTYPKDVMESVSFSISIWKDTLFPTLFPFFVFSFFVSTYGISYLFEELLKPITVHILHLSVSSGFIIASSLFSGFPSSSKFIKDALDNKIIDIKDANHLLSFCHFSSPLFVIGTIGSLLLGDKSLGIVMFICHVLAAFLIGIIFRGSQKENDSFISFKSAFRRMRSKQKSAPHFATVLKNSIMSALDTLFLLLGIVTIFLILTNLFTKLIPITENFKAIFSGILEMTQGIKNASLLSISLFIRSLLMISFISFGGLSIHTQVLSILAGYSISYKRYFLSRILHVIFSSFLLFLCFNIFHIS